MRFHRFFILCFGFTAGDLPATEPTNSNLNVFGENSQAYVQSLITGSLTNDVQSVSQAKAATISSMDVLDDRQKLGLGDRLSFRIVEDRDEVKELFVTDSGELEIPYVGRVAAAGKTCKALSHEIKASLEKEYYYQATVILAVDLLNKSRGKVYLVGQVRVAGPQDIPSDEDFTLSKAILRAGGFGDFADKKKVKITRTRDDRGDQTETLVVDVAGILEQGRKEKDIPLKPDDLIFIPARLINL